MAEALLKIEKLEAWYGESHALHGVGLEIAEGEVVTLLGRNGAGKTSTLRAVMGLVGRRSGSIRFEGREMVGMRSDLIARTGIAYCPEERGIFASLDVTENLCCRRRCARAGLAWTRSTRCSRTSRSAPARRAPSCPAASSRCWRSAASCAPAPSSCCWMSPPKGWPR
jgi:ABC-type branched-subunit amino acid transport system ATPase component